MKPKVLSGQKIFSWNPNDMEAYWAQSRAFDQRPFDTHSIMGGTFNQCDSEKSFALLFKSIATQL